MLHHGTNSHRIIVCFRIREVGTMKKNIYFRPFFLIGAFALIVVIGSWFLFPDWRVTPGGFWVLLVGGVSGVLVFASSLLSIAKDWKDLFQPEKDSLKKSNTTINTGGGTYIVGNVNTGDSAFIGRDQSTTELDKDESASNRPEQAKGSRKKTSRSSNKAGVTVRNFNQVGNENTLAIQQDDVLVDRSEQQGEGNQIIIGNNKGKQP